MKSRFHYLLLFSLSWVNTGAQLNESDTLKFQLRSSITGNCQQGNVDVLTIRGRADLSCRPVKDIVFKSQNSVLYQEFYRNKADNDIFSRNYFYFKPQQKIYPFAIAYVSTNYRRKITARYFAGAGCTYQVLNKANHILKISAGAVYEHSSFKDTRFNDTRYDSNGNIDLWRGTLYAGGWSFLFNRHLRIYYDAYWQPAFQNNDNYRTQADIGIDLPVWKGLSVTALYIYTHEEVVVKNIKQKDQLLTWGLSYQFKKR